MGEQLIVTHRCSAPVALKTQPEFHCDIRQGTEAFVTDVDLREVGNCAIPRCGDGTVDPWEQCDTGEANSNAPDAICRESCVLQTCGDLIVDSGEECDDGNDDPDDACTNACRWNP